MEIEKPETVSFLQLETFCKDKNFGKIVYVLKPDLDKMQIKLGRGHDADVKISDISVSRVHARVTMTKNGFLLEDNFSKFGTLLLLPSVKHEIDNVNGLAVQVGRTTLSLTVTHNDYPIKAQGLQQLTEGVLDRQCKSPSSDLCSA